MADTESVLCDNNDIREPTWATDLAALALLANMSFMCGKLEECRDVMVKMSLVGARSNKTDGQYLVLFDKNILI